MALLKRKLYRQVKGRKSHMRIAVPLAEDNLRHLVSSRAGFKEINQANRTVGLAHCLTDLHA
jgi:hypothetical protein